MKRKKVLALVVATVMSVGTLVSFSGEERVFAQGVLETINGEENSDIFDNDDFNNQESFDDSNYDKIDENEVDAQGIDDSGARASENYYNFNISGAEKYTYGTSGKGRPLYYYKIGSGEKVLFLNFGLHGYEDAWSKDGEELTKLAKNLIERVVRDNVSGGLNGWTVVIVPSSNPDGVLDGWTNNGPGRTQVSQKIDLNRCFPTFFTPQYSARYYTGSTPLGAPEAKALASLVDQYSASSSHMALVDVHGWLNQTIGDPSLGKAFNTSFGISNKLMSTSASGYLISYAHSKGALATLLELPMPSNSASIQNNGYANKIYSGVKSIINNGDGFEVMNVEGQVNTSSLNIRITTSTNSNIIGTYSNGTKIKILGKVGDWYQVNSSAGYGYVHKDYVKILNNENNEELKANLSAFLDSAYKKAFNRTPDEEGKNYWMNLLGSRKQSGRYFLMNLLNEPEFINRNMTSKEYIVAMYDIIFDRQPDDGGFNHWFNKYETFKETMSEKEAKLEVLKWMMNEPEFREVCAKMGVDF